MINSDLYFDSSRRTKLREKYVTISPLKRSSVDVLTITILTSGTITKTTYRRNGQIFDPEDNTYFEVLKIEIQ